MAETVYLAGMLKVQLQYSFDFHDPLALNTFYCYGAGVEGATAAELDDFTAAVGTEWSTAGLEGYMSSTHSLLNVWCADWSGPTGNEGLSLINTPGDEGGAALTAQACVLVNFEVPLRYRGGHPRLYMPLGTVDSMSTPILWLSDFVSNLQGAFNTFFSWVNEQEIGGSPITWSLYRTRQKVADVLQPPSHYPVSSPTVSPVPATIRRRVRRAGHRR